MAFCARLSLRIVSRLTYTVAYVIVSVLILAEEYPAVERDHILFVCPSTDGHVGCLRPGALTNFAAMGIHVQVFVWTDALILLTRNPANELLDHMVTMPNISRLL